MDFANSGRGLYHAEEAAIAKYALATVQEKQPSVSAAYVRQLMDKDITYGECYKRVCQADTLGLA